MKLSAFALALGLSISSLGLLACSSDSSGVDSTTGQAISDLDIGGDITIDTNATKQVTATVKYADGTTKDVTTDSSLVWNIDDTNVATITSAGLVTGKSVGATKIHATFQGTESASHALVVH